MGFISSVGKSFRNLSGLGGSIGNLGLTTPGMGFGDINDFLIGKDPSVAAGTVGKWNKGQEELFNTLQKYLNKGIAPGAPYEGKLPGTAPIGSLEQMSLAGLEKLFSGDLFKQLGEGPGYGGFEKQNAEGVGPYDQFRELFTHPVLQKLLQGPGAGVLPEAKNAITSMLQIRPEDIAQYYKTTVSDPMMQQFTEEIMLAIKRAGAPRLWGTDYQTQEQYASRDLERGLIQGRGAATSEYLNRALSAAGLAPSISEAESRGVQTRQAGYQTLADILSKGVSDYTGIIGTKSTAEAQRMAAEAQKAGLTPTAISTMMSALSQGAQLVETT